MSIEIAGGATKLAADFYGIESGELRRVLIAGSGAMLSPTSTQQGESIPSISYAVCIEGGKV